MSSRRFYVAGCVALLLWGCRSARDGHPDGSTSSTARASARSSGRHAAGQAPIVRVVNLFDQRPWLSLDASGDRDPEGIQYRVFLDGGEGRGVFRDGTIHVSMYRISRTGEGLLERRLVSDWHVSTSEVIRVSARILGKGYHLKLRWASKTIAGQEVEIVTEFEDTLGQRTRSGTKRLRVPTYQS